MSCFRYISRPLWTPAWWSLLI